MRGAMTPTGAMAAFGMAYRESRRRDLNIIFQKIRNRGRVAF